MDDKMKLLYLHEIIVTEILSMSEEELRAEVSESEAAGAREIFQTARSTLGKARLARAQGSIALYRSQRSTSNIQRNAGEALRVVSPQGLTMAARNARAEDSADQAGIDEDLAELAQWEDEDRKKP